MNACALVATPPGFNAGMVAVELGLQAFVRDYLSSQSVEVRQLCSFEQRLAGLDPGERDEELRRAAVPEKSAILESVDELDDYDLILYWGDFLHMAQYIRAMGALFPALNARLAGNCKGRVERLLLLEQAPEDRLAKTVSFGTTLLFNCLGDAMDAAYYEKFVRFARLAGRVRVRDVLSAAFLARARQDYAQSYWGPDCAQFLKSEDFGRAAADGVGYVFFARTAGVPSEMGDFILRLADQRQMAWLPWGSLSAFPYLNAARALAQSFAPIGTDLSAWEMLARISRGSLVITDTYHLCVVAWTLGVPAVCVAGPLPSVPVDVSSGRRFCWRDKREVFFSQYDALDFFVRFEELGEKNRAQARLDHLQALLRSPAEIHRIADNIRRHTTAVGTELATWIQRKGS